MTVKQRSKELIKKYGIDTAKIVVEELLTVLQYQPPKDPYGFEWYKFYSNVKQELKK